MEMPDFSVPNLIFLNFIFSRVLSLGFVLSLRRQTEDRL